MAQSSLLSQLAKKSLRYKLAVLGFTLIALGFLYYQFRYSGLSDKQSSLESKKTGLVALGEKLDEELVEMQQLTEKHKQLQRTIRDNERALPEEPELPALQDHLERKAGESGVSIENWSVRDSEPVDIYIRLPVDMEIKGTFYQIMHFFALLGKQEKDPLADVTRDGDDTAEPRIDERIVTIANLEMGGARLESGDLKLAAKFVVSTFHQKKEEKKKPDPKAKAAQPAAKPAAKSGGNSGGKSGGTSGAGQTQDKPSGGDRQKDAIDRMKGRVEDGSTGTTSPNSATPSGGASGGGRFGGRAHRRSRGERVRLTAGRVVGTHDNHRSGT